MNNDKLQQSLSCTLQKAQSEMEKGQTEGMSTVHKQNLTEDTMQNILLNSIRAVTKINVSRRQMFQRQLTSEDMQAN